ncbi:MAG: hypothetical protein AABY18_05165 [Candidatus Thermoplasmatota archaeon]|mgnify:CR=1 FL=1
MRLSAILGLALLAAALAAPVAAARPVPTVPVHVEVVQCVTDPCPPQIWCDPADTQNGAIRYERFHDCSERISIDFIDCLWGEHWETYTAGPVTVRYSACSQPE